MTSESVPVLSTTKDAKRQVGKFISALLNHDGPRQRVEDYGNDILRLLDAIEAEARDAERTASAARIEDAVARAIYEDMRMRDSEGRNRPWVPGGNSLKQEEARQRASAALASEAHRG